MDYILVWLIPIFSTFCQFEIKNYLYYFILAVLFYVSHNTVSNYSSILYKSQLKAKKAKKIKKVKIINITVIKINVEVSLIEVIKKKNNQTIEKELNAKLKLN